jgi:hypothetical protein
MTKKPNQVAKFRQAARELEADDNEKRFNEKRFNEKLGKIARQKPAPRPQRKSKWVAGCRPIADSLSLLRW